MNFKIKNLITVFLAVFYQTASAQFFSGELTYTLKIIPQKNGLNIDSMMNAEPGTSSIYLITDHYYKSTYFRDGKETYSYTYHDDEKRMYDETTGKDYVTYRDSRKGNTSRIRSIIYKDSLKEVAGHQCFMVERVYEKYVSKTYYAKDLKINPESFQGHAVGDWYNQIKEVDGCLSLGGINEYATHIEQHIVSKINERKVDSKEFSLPNKTVVASFTSLDKRVMLIPPSDEVRSCYQEKIAAAKKPQSEKVTIYVEFICSENGTISNITPYKKDEYGLSEIAVDIIKSCGFKFTPGQIAGAPVSSLAYFPIEFK